MNITSKRSWSAIRQPFAPVVQPTQGVNNQHLVPALEHKRLHRPATVPTSEPGTPVSSVLPLLPTHARQNHTHVSDSVALNNPYGRLTDALPDAYFLDHAPTHPQTSWPHLGHAFSLPTLPSGTVASDAMFSGSISPDHWPSLPPEPAHLHPHVEPELASSLTPASGSPASSIFSSSTAWAHRQRLNNEQRGGTWSE